MLTSGIYSSDDPSTLISGVTYTYNNPLAQLKDITRTDGQKYSFTYDIWGRVTDIKVGNKLLSHSVYRKASSDTQLSYTEYGNGDRVYYTYDGLDRIIALSTTEGGTPYVTYDYNSEGLVGRVTDNLSGVSAEYHYDLLGRLVSSTLSQGGIDRYFYTYNESNQLTSVSTYLPTGELSVTCVYTYGEDGRLASVTEGEYTVHYTYDVLSRVTCERTVHEDGAEYYTYYSYLEADNGNTTSFVETVTYKTKASGASAETTVGSIHYTYDKNGFISSITQKDANGNTTSSESYTYDALGQLKTVTRGSNVTEYTYDNSGNILSKKVNGSVVSTYTYSDSQWKDLLTAYNGETITYDGIGNPIHYLGNSTLTWDMGRRLTDYESAGVNVSYVYDASGQRVSKIVNGVTTEFYYDDRGILVLSSRSDGTELRFYADANGNIDSFSYNGEQYYYVRNAQNDIIGITDKNGAFVARYSYDEWGNITAISDGNGVDVSNNPSHIANLNPLRYRSYFYDTETGFYWLNTRYYDPEIGRFINADGYVSTGQGVIGHNMFAYCGNNPVNFVDPNGTSLKDIFEYIEKIVEAICNAITFVVSIIKKPTKTSSDGVKFIADYEGGFSSTPYDDGAGNLTIGYGHLILDNESFNSITEDEALALLAKDLKKAEDRVNNYSKEIGFIIWDQNQFDALVSLSYNSGKNVYFVMDQLSAGNDVYESFGTIIKSGGRPLLGLYRRRMDEADMYTNGTYNRTYRGWGE